MNNKKRIPLNVQKLLVAYVVAAAAIGMPALVGLSTGASLHPDALFNLVVALLAARLILAVVEVETARRTQ